MTRPRGPHPPSRRAAVASAPGRVNLIGEHLDYLGGRCLSLALGLRTTARVVLRDDDVLTVRSGDRVWRGSTADLVPGAVRGWAAYVVGVLWALEVHHGADVEVSTTLPVGAGLSSSAALACSVAVAVDELLGLGLERHELAETAYRAESEYVGAPTGRLDQLVSLLAEPGQALLVDFAGAAPTWERVPFVPAEAGLSLLAIDTRVVHDMRVGGYGERRTESEAAARLLGLDRLGQVGAVDASAVAGLPEVLARRARYVSEELVRVEAFAAYLRAGEWAPLGPLMDAGHAGARDDFEISCPELDAAVDAARRGGALGARMTGGGFGGSAVALVPTDAVEDVTDAVTEAFVRRRWAAPSVFEVEAGAGAGLA